MGDTFDVPTLNKALEAAATCPEAVETRALLDWLELYGASIEFGKCQEEQEGRTLTLPSCRIRLALWRIEAHGPDFLSASRACKSIWDYRDAS